MTRNGTKKKTNQTDKKYEQKKINEEVTEIFELGRSISHESTELLFYITAANAAPTEASDLSFITSGNPKTCSTCF